MASRDEDWRRRFRRRLARVPRQADPAAALLARLLGAPAAEFTEFLARPSRDAAVLVGLVDLADGPGILLTERAAHLANHPGQISFPGGRLHPDEGHADAALREAEEEVALAPSQVTVLGQLPAQLTTTGFVVTPVIGWIEGSFTPVPDPSEVASAFVVPVGHLAGPGNRGQSIRTRWSTRFRSDEFYFERHLIWGATAAILSNLLELIDDGS